MSIPKALHRDVEKLTLSLFQILDTAPSRPTLQNVIDLMAMAGEIRAILVEFHINDKNRYACVLLCSLVNYKMDECKKFFEGNGGWEIGFEEISHI